MAAQYDGEGLTKEKFEAMIQLLDKDGDGTVSQSEFTDVWMSMNGKPDEEPSEELKARANATWKQMDADGDGNLTVEELAMYYGFNYTAGVATAMTDEQILETLALQAALFEKEEAKAKAIKEAQEEAMRLRKPLRDKTIKIVTVDASQRSRRASKDDVKDAGEAKVVEFLKSCQIGDLENPTDPEEDTVMKFLDQKIPVRVENEKGEMPLHLLARFKVGEDKGGKKREMFKKTVSTLIALMKEQAKAAGLAGIQSDINHQDKEGKTPLFMAVEYKNLELIKHLFDKSILPEAEQPDYLLINNMGWTILHACVSADDIEVLEAVLRKITPQRQKMLLSTKDKSQREPLHIGAYRSSEATLRFLMNMGANKEAKDAAGITAGELALKAGRRASKEIIDGTAAAGA